MKPKTQKYFFSMQPDAGLNDLIVTFASLRRKVKTKAIGEHLKRTLPAEITRLLRKTQEKTAL